MYVNQPGRRAYGPLASVIVQVDVYVPVLALPGTLRFAVNATLTGPAPVAGAASKILTAAGGEAPAGIVTG